MSRLEIFLLVMPFRVLSKNLLPSLFDASLTNDPKTIKESLSIASQDVDVSNARVSESGTVIVNLPSVKSPETAVANLQATFAGQFVIQPPEQKISMILITGVPSELNVPSMVSNILQKQEFITDKVRNGELFEIERTWKQKHNPGNDALQNFVIKCSLAIRNFIMNSNGGYVYVELSRLRVHDFVSLISNASIVNVLGITMPLAVQIRINLRYVLCAWGSIKPGIAGRIRQISAVTVLEISCQILLTVLCQKNAPAFCQPEKLC